MSNHVIKALNEIQKSIEALYDFYKNDEIYQNELNFAVGSIEQARGAVEFYENSGQKKGKNR